MKIILKNYWTTFTNVFSINKKKTKRNNKNIDKPDIILITLFYVAKSQKEQLNLQKS